LAESCISNHTNVDYEIFVNSLAAGTCGHEFQSLAKELLIAYNDQPIAEKYNGMRVGPVLMGIIKRLERKYKIYGPKILNAFEYGAPQSRKRLFLIGIRKDVIGQYSFPELTHHLPQKPQIDLRSAPTCEDALSDLPDVDKFPHLIGDDKLDSRELHQLDCIYSAEMRLSRLGDDNMILPRLDWNPFIVDCCTRTIHSEEVLDRLKNTGQGIQDKKSGKTRLNKYGVSNTLRAGTKEEKGSHTAVRPVHYSFNRVVTVREGARLMGFPDWMTFHPTKWHGFRLVGNAVPFQLGRAVACSIKNVLDRS
jgi:DNA (cytosine-5)-methyltransferase 1